MALLIATAVLSAIASTHGVAMAATHVTVTPPPSDLTGPFGWNEPAWVAASAIAAMVAAAATVTLAIMTWSLARATSTMASETRDLVIANGAERVQAERHHQEQMMPLIILQASGKLLTTEGKRTFRIQGRVGNVGSAPATAVLLRVRPDSNKTFRAPLTVLGGSVDSDFCADFPIEDPVHDDGMIGFSSVVTFKSIFGTVGAVYQTSPTGDMGKQKVDQVILCSENTKPVAELIRNRMQDDVDPLV